MNRRELLRTIPAAATMLAAHSSRVFAQTPSRWMPLGIQYGGPRPTADENRAAMDTFKRMGYDLIEPVNMRGFDPDEFRRICDRAGMKLRSIHITSADTSAPQRGQGRGRAAGAAPAGPPPGQAPARGPNPLQSPVPGGPGRRRPQQVIDSQDATYTPEGILSIVKAQAPVVRDLGVEYGVLGASSISSYKSIDAIKRMAEAHNQANIILRGVGVKLSYHSHEFDFWPVEGRIGYDVLLENTDPSIQYQVDIGWAVVGGADIVSLINKHSTRIGLFHMRDVKNDNVETAGEGTLDWTAIFKAMEKIKDPLCYVEGGDAAVAARDLRTFGWGHPA